MTPRERVLSAWNHVQPDCTPCDYFSTPEIHGQLVEHFDLDGSRHAGLYTHGDNKVAECLGTDMR
jgi:hypothetical protein